LLKKKFTKQDKLSTFRSSLFGSFAEKFNTVYKKEKTKSKFYNDTYN